MKYLLIACLLLSLTMCSEKVETSESDQESKDQKKSYVKVILGADLAYKWKTNGAETIKIKTPIYLQQLLLKLKIEPSTLGDYYGAAENAHFGLVLESGVEKQILCRITKDSGFKPYENKLIDLKNGDTLLIGELAR